MSPYALSPGRHGFFFHDRVKIKGRGGLHGVVTGWGPEDYVRVRFYLTRATVTEFVRAGTLKLVEKSVRRLRYEERSKRSG